MQRFSLGRKFDVGDSDVGDFMLTKVFWCDTNDQNQHRSPIVDDKRLVIHLSTLSSTFVTNIDVAFSRTYNIDNIQAKTEHKKAAKEKKIVEELDEQKKAVEEMLKKRKEDELKEAATKLAKDVEAEKAKLEEERKLEELRLKKKFQQDKEEAKKKEELKKQEDEKKAEEEEKLRKEQERRKAEEDNMKKKLEETMKRRKGMYYSIYDISRSHGQESTYRFRSRSRADGFWCADS